MKKNNRRKSDFYLIATQTFSFLGVFFSVLFVPNFFSWIFFFANEKNPWQKPMQNPLKKNNEKKFEKKLIHTEKEGKFQGFRIRDAGTTFNLSNVSTCLQNICLKEEGGFYISENVSQTTNFICLIP